MLVVEIVPSSPLDGARHNAKHDFENHRKRHLWHVPKNRRRGAGPWFRGGFTGGRGLPVERSPSGRRWASLPRFGWNSNHHTLGGEVTVGSTRPVLAFGTGRFFRSYARFDDKVLIYLA